jgi:hypothetical protein
MRCPTCNTDVDQHEASDCLNRFALSIVCGITDKCAGPTIMIEPNGDGGVIPACTVCNYIGWDFPSHAPAVPSFPDDIAMAWRLVRRFEGFDVKLYSHADGWVFVIYKDAIHYEGEAGLKQEALAITRAAIKAARGKDQ